MIEINLHPGGQKRRAGSAPRSGGRKLALPSMPQIPADPWLLGLSAAGVLLLIGIGLMLWRTGETRASLEARIDQEVADSIRYASTIALLETAEARQDTIEQKIGMIREVDERRYIWPHVMAEVSRALPPYTWLSELREVDGGTPTAPAFVLEGYVGVTEALTRFMTQLESSPFLRDVTLVTTGQVEEDGRTVRRFTLEARYRRPDPTFIETVPIVVEEDS